MGKVILVTILMLLVMPTLAWALPDLIISDIVWEPENPIYGSVAEIKAYVENIGSESTEQPFLVEIVSTELYISEAFKIGPLEPGEGVYTPTIIREVYPGDYEITAEVDIDQIIDESNEQNNQYSENMHVYFGPDLVVNDIVWFPENPDSDDEIYISAIIGNIGDLASDGFDVKITITDERSTEIVKVCTVYVFGVEPGQNYPTSNINCIVENLIPGDYKILVEADVYDVIEEPLHEDNNIDFKIMHVSYGHGVLPITFEDANQIEPSISDKYVVWADNRDGYYKIYRFDLETEETEIVPISFFQHNRNPTISTDLIAWETWYDGFMESAGIFIYNLDTGGAILATHKYGLTCINPKAFGTTVVVQCYESSSLCSNIYAIYWDGVGIPQWEQLTNDNDKFNRQPSIYGNNVVWSKDFDIYKMNLNTKKTTKITKSKSAFYPDIGPNTITYEDFRDGATSVYRYDVWDEKEELIGRGINPSSPKLWTGHYQYDVVWAKSVDFQYDIFAYDEYRDLIEQITDMEGDQKDPEIYSDKIVFTNYENGNGDIYIYIP